MFNGPIEKPATFRAMDVASAASPRVRSVSRRQKPYGDPAATSGTKSGSKLVTVKILVVGDLVGHHRSQTFIKALLHKDLGSEGACVLSFAIPGLYMAESETDSLLHKVLRKLRNAVVSVLFISELLVKVPFCDKVYFLAMNHRLFPTLHAICWIWRKPIITDLYVSIYDGAEDRGRTRAGFFHKLVRGNFAWYLKMLDRMIIERSSKVIYVGKTELGLVAATVGADLSKCDCVIIPSASPRKRMAAPSESPTFRVCWWGTFTPFHGVDNILRAAALLNEKRLDFRLDLFGTPKHDSSEYERLTDELGLAERVSFHKDKTFGNKKLDEFLCDKCDLALGNFSTTHRAKRAVPTKIIDAFAMQLPVISMDTEVLRETTDPDNDLFVCEGSPESLADSIEQLIGNRDELARRAKNGYSAYDAKFSPEAVQAKFIEAIRNT
jgi:glycosyltransferase involved in cell wall biosynthesis